MNPAKCAKDTKNRLLVQAVRLAHRVNNMIPPTQDTRASSRHRRSHKCPLRLEEAH